MRKYLWQKLPQSQAAFVIQGPHRREGSSPLSGAYPSKLTQWVICGPQGQGFVRKLTQEPPSEEKVWEMKEFLLCKSLEVWLV